MSIIIKNSPNLIRIVKSTQGFSIWYKLQMFHFIKGGTVTVMNSEGKEVQLNTSALQAAVAQNAMGT